MTEDLSTKPRGRTTGLLARMRRNWGKTTTAGVIALLVVWFAWPEGEEPPLPPVTVPVTRGDIESSIAAAGTLEAGNSVDVGAQMSGQLLKLHVKPGDVVSEGDLLAEVDGFIQRTRVASSAASLEALVANTLSMEAGLELSRARVQRQERLMQAKATSEVEYDQAVLNLTQSEANLKRHKLQIEQARASLQEATALLDFARITAPSTGTIVSVLVQEGQTLNATQTTPIILRIGNLNVIKITAVIPEADIGQLTPGMEAYFTTLSSGERRWATRLQEISPLPRAAGSAGGMANFDALLEIDNPDGALLPGMGAKVFLLTRAVRDVLKVPLGALTFTSGAGPKSAAQQFAMRDEPEVDFSAAGQDSRSETPNRPDARRSGLQPGQSDPERRATVQVVGSNGEIEIREVKVGFDNEIEAEILSGLQEGETVVGGINQPPMTRPDIPGFIYGP